MLLAFSLAPAPRAAATAPRAHAKAVASHTLAAPSPSSAEVLLEHVKRAVVVVNSYDERGRVQSRGTGFFVRPGQVVPNLHVVGRAARVEVRTFDGRSRSVAGVIALSQGRDLALMQIAGDCQDVATLPFDDGETRTGEEIFVVGNPQGHAWTVSRGRTLAVWESQDVGALVRISAPIERGSSGSPVVNLRGRVVGVATLSRKGVEDSFFAVPSDEAARLRPAALRPFPLETSE